MTKSSSDHPIRESSPAAGASGARMWGAIIAHAVVDFFSFVVVPLMSVLEGHTHMTHAQGALILGAGSLSSGLIQPVVALASDRFDTRSLGTLGLLVAVVCVSAIGFVHSFEQLLMLQIVAAAGIGAFHPVAAAAVGHLAGTHRSRALAIFHASGMIGGTLGNVITPLYVAFFAAQAMGGARAASDGIESGLTALAWLAIPGLAFVVVLAWAIHSIPHRHHTAAADHAALPASERRARWWAVGLLYAGNVLRFTTDMCLIQLIIRWSEVKALLGTHGVELSDAARAAAAQINGPMQGAKQIGMGAGGLTIGFLIARHREKLVLFVVPLIGAVALAFMPQTGAWTKLSDGGGVLAMLLCFTAGVGYAGVIPTTISLAQRLLPHRTSLASGLMMGGAWAIASIGPQLAQWLSERLGLSGAFIAVAAILGASSLLSIPLPTRMLHAKVR